MSTWDKVKITLLLLAWTIVFYPIFPPLVHDWLGHSDNSHGFIVPVMAGYFILQRKEQLRLATIGSSWFGGGILFLSLALYILSTAGGITFPSRVALVLSLLGLVWCCLGKEIIRVLVFPIIFLLFMIPVPYSIISLVSLPLQLMATRISVSVIDLCSIPVYREGNMLFFMGTQLEVAEACSGIRSIMALTMIACAFASMVEDGWLKKTILIVAAIPIAMVANILRISGTGILAHFFGDKVARGFLHEFSGILIFIFGFGALFGIFTLLKRKKRADV